jgi:PAS domain S-box-containing protein
MSFRVVTAAGVRAACSGALLIGVGAVIGAAAGQARARTRMRSAAADLEQTNARAVQHAGLLQAILDSSSDGIAVIDGNGESLLDNPAAKAILGALDDTGTEKWQDNYGFFHPDDQRPFAPDEMPLVRALAGQASEQVPMLIRNDANPAGVIISVCAHPMHDPNGQNGAVAVFHDITALRQREADLASFAGIVAHDLKSPLTAIVGYAELVRDEIPDLPAAAVPMLDRVLATGKRMDQLIHDLLSYASARDSVLNAVDLDLRAIVDDIINDRFAAANLVPSAPESEAKVGPLDAVHADPAMIRQLVDNLIGNALKYTKPGEAAQVDISSAPSAPGWVRVEITDRGIGIPAGQHRAIFEDFHRAHSRSDYAGTGLGLAICDRIITRHGGRIGADDNPGGGARFWFTLPTADQTNRTRAAATTTTANPVLPASV